MSLDPNSGAYLSVISNCLQTGTLNFIDLEYYEGIQKEKQTKVRIKEKNVDKFQKVKKY